MQNEEELLTHVPIEEGVFSGAAGQSEPKTGASFRQTSLKMHAIRPERENRYIFMKKAAQWWLQIFRNLPQLVNH